MYNFLKFVINKVVKNLLLDRLGLKHASYGFHYCNNEFFKYRGVKYRFS